MSDTAKVSDMAVAGTKKDDICLEKVRFVSKMKPSLRAESTEVIDRV